MTDTLREKGARLIHFMHGDGLNLESALSPSNDAHWHHWTVVEPEGTEDAYATIDAIIALIQGEGMVPNSSDWLAQPSGHTTRRDVLTDAAAMLDEFAERDRLIDAPVIAKKIRAMIAASAGEGK